MTDPKTDKGFEALAVCIQLANGGRIGTDSEIIAARIELTRAREMRELLETAYHCLQSYVYGNSDPTLAKECCAAVRRCWRRNERQCSDSYSCMREHF